MNWSNLLISASILTARLPLDRILIRPRDKAKALEEFVATLPATKPQSSTAAPPVSNPGVSEVAETTIVPVAPSVSSMPTTEETIAELKRRLGKELYRAELDLANKLRIVGKPCDCLSAKHNLGIEALAEELIPKEPDNPVYDEIIDWFRHNQNKVTIPAIMSGQYDQEYPRMAAEFTKFRKRVIGTTTLSTMIAPKQEISLEKAKAEAAKLASEEVERQWQSTEKT